MERRPDTSGLRFAGILPDELRGRIDPLLSRLNLRLITCAVVLLVFTACNQSNSNTTPKNADTKGTTGSNVKTGAKPAPDAQVAVIETADYGKIVVELYPNIAPQMVERFKKLINEKFYDGTAVHRIDPNLGIIQGGDALTKKSNSAAWGTGS